MSDSTVIDDLFERNHLETLCEWARDGRPIPLQRLRALAYGSANASDRERYGPGWLAALVDLAQRAGVGQLERDEDGAVAFYPMSDVPSFEDAWRRATRSWDELDPAG
jgi:hypothetical protein